MAAIPYILVLIAILSGDIYGNFDINIFGLRLSLSTLLPIIIYYYVNKDHEVNLISLHVKKSMNYFIKYILISSLLSILVTALGYGVLKFDPIALFTSGILGLTFVLPFIVIVIWAIIRSTIGCINAFKFILPDNTAWKHD